MDDDFKFSKYQLDLLLTKEERLAISPSVYQRLAQTDSLFMSALNSGVTGAEICSDSDRGDQINWMISMGQEFKLGLGIIGLSTAIFDRVLCATKVKTKFVFFLHFLKLILNFHPFEI